MMNPKDEISNTAKHVDINKVKLELRHIRDCVNILLDSLDSKGSQVTSSTEENSTNAAQPEKVPNGVYNAVNPKEFDPLQQKSQQEKVEPKQQEIGKTPPPENPAGGETAAADIKPPASMVQTMGSNPAGVNTAVSNPNIPRSTPQQGEYYMSNSTGML